jgi:uncharacterized protein (TIGR03067 family)
MKTNSLKLLLAMVGLLVAAGPANDEEAKKDAEKMQGTWAAISYVQDGQGEGEKGAAEDSPIRFVFKGDRITILVDVEEASAKGTFKLDASGKPRTIDMVFPGVPDAKNRQVGLGIYEVDGDTLKLCYGPDGVKRPTEFKSLPKSQHNMFIFKRIKK